MVDLLVIIKYVCREIRYISHRVGKPARTVETIPKMAVGVKLFSYVMMYPFKPMHTTNRDRQNINKP